MEWWILKVIGAGVLVSLSSWGVMSATSDARDVGRLVGYFLFGALGSLGGYWLGTHAPVDREAAMGLGCLVGGIVISYVYGMISCEWRMRRRGGEHSPNIF